MRATSISSAALAITVSASVALAGVSVASARPATAAIPLTSSHAQVIAQGVVSFTAGAHHWRLATNDVGTAAVDIEIASPTFLIAASGAVDAGAVRITEAEGLGWLLADGEATFPPAGSAVSVAPTPGAVVHEIAIDVGDGADAFDPGDGLRDLDLVRDVLAGGESLTVRSDVRLGPDRRHCRSCHGGRRQRNSSRRYPCHRRRGDAHQQRRYPDGDTRGNHRHHRR
jgi:hypothetical protein